MIKKILNEKEKKIFDYAVRPFIIFTILTWVIVIIGDRFLRMSPDTTNGYICSMLLLCVVTYLNSAFIELSNIELHSNKKYNLRKDKDRVIPFGIGKTRITIDIDELPEDIKYGLIERYSSGNSNTITYETKTIVICGDAVSIELWEEFTSKI